MSYKITIYGNNIYKEVKLRDDANMLSIGTDKNCHVRFSRKTFHEEFRIDIEKMDGKYVAYCSGNTYISTRTAAGNKLCYLEPGDRIIVTFEKSGIDFLSMDFAIDYATPQDDYNLGLVIPADRGIAIGSSGNCDIRIKRDISGLGIVSMVKTSSGYKLGLRNFSYGIEVNGYITRDEIVDVSNGDFFCICGVSFLASNECIYTGENEIAETTLKKIRKNLPNNHYKYPLFIRNPRQLFVMSDKQVEVLPPQPIPAESNANLIASVLPMVIMLVLMIGVRSMMGSNMMYMLYFGASMGMSVIMSIVSYFTGKKNVRQQKIDRINKYNDYIDRKEVEVEELQKEERVICEKTTPSIETLLQFVEHFDARLFERKKGHADYLDVCVGIGRREAHNQIDFRAQDSIDTGDNLQEYPEEMSKKYKYLDDMPIQLSLNKVNAVGVLGIRNKLYQFAKNMVFSIASQHFYQDVNMFFIMDENDVPYFSWARWLPNTENKSAGIRYFIYDEESKKYGLQFLYSELSSRELKGGTEGKPNFVVFVYKSDIVSGHPILKYVEMAKSLGFTFIFFEEHEEMLHYAVDEKVYLDTQQNTGVIQSVYDGMKEQKFVYQHVAGARVAQAALKLAPVYIDEVSLESTLTKHISLYELMHIMSAYELDLGKRWRESRIWDSIAAPIGVLASGKTMALDIHEKYHGPHGLVAGTTGSGKSELLQTYIITLASLFHPYELGFVLIDFKGGGMANQFKDLPHLNGAITNIDGKQIDRSLISIHAELIKRQMLFAKYEVNRIDDYIKLYRDGVTQTPLPHLILIVDEFAELKTDQPEFMKELISTARIGRSLGVHLILATQKPAGVVNDQIWSNSKFKICLKVQDKSDSNEVLKSPLAAEIKEPGRAYLQVGNNEIFELFQSAYSGEKATIEDVDKAKAFAISKVELSGKRETIYAQKPEKQEGGESQLDALIQYIGDYCEHEHIARLSPICLPALEEVIPYNPEVPNYEGSNIVIPIGIYDAPERQEQGVLTLNLTSGNTLFVGSSQNGKTNMLQLIIRGIAERYTPEDARIYILDFGTGFLANYGNLKHVGGVVKPTDDEKIANLFRVLKEELEKRKEALSKIGLSSFASYRDAGYHEFEQEIIILDDYISFKNIFGEYVDQLTDLLREGPAMGMVFVLTSPLASSFGYRLLAYFSNRYSFAANDNSDYGFIFDHCKLRPDNVPGRMIYQSERQFYEAQTYLVFDAEREIERIKLIREFIEQINARYAASNDVAIPEVPEIVTPEIIDSLLEERQDFLVPVGMSYKSIKPVCVDLIDRISIVIAGKKHFGRRSFVHYLVNYMNNNNAQAPVDTYILDNYKDEYKDLADVETVKLYTTDEDVFNQNLMNVFNTLEERRAKKEQPKPEDPFALLVINSNDYYQNLTMKRDILEIYKKLFTKYKNDKVFIVILDCEVTVGTMNLCEFLRLVRDERCAMAFENISEQHVMELPGQITRKYQKKIEPGDAYLMDATSFYKVRAVYDQNSLKQA